MSGCQSSRASARAVVALCNDELIITTQALAAEHLVKCLSPLTCRDFPADTSLTIAHVPGPRDG